MHLQLLSTWSDGNITHLMNSVSTFLVSWESIQKNYLIDSVTVARYKSVYLLKCKLLLNLLCWVLNEVDYLSEHLNTIWFHNVDKYNSLTILIPVHQRNHDITWSEWIRLFYIDWMFRKVHLKENKLWFTV